MRKTKEEVDDEIFKYFKSETDKGNSISRAYELTMSKFNLLTTTRIRRIRIENGDMRLSGRPKVK